MNSSSYESLLEDLGFTAVKRGQKLQHPNDPPTVYFNRKRNGLVYFTAMRRDQQRFSAQLWQEIAPQQKRARRTTLMTLVPIEFKEREALQALIAVVADALTQDVREARDERESRRIQQRNDIDPAAKTILVLARHGLGVYRENLEQIETACRMTGVLDRRHLRATHIKPWHQSDDQEKLDGFNGLLLSPHVKHLFDRGHISFTDAGSLLVSERMNDAVLNAWGLKRGQQVGAFGPEQSQYLAYHRAHIFEHKEGGRRVAEHS
jgi:predicted restriction endonuclease